MISFGCGTVWSWLDVARLGDTYGIRTRHQRGPRNTANRLGIKIGELQPLLGHAVDVRRFDLLRTKTPQIFIALIVGENENNVRLLPGF